MGIIVWENEYAAQVARANLLQWRKVAEAEPALPFHEAEEPKLIQCDCCDAVVPEEETVGGGYCERYCFHCADTAQGERWTPEEFFEEGGEL